VPRYQADAGGHELLQTRANAVGLRLVNYARSVLNYARSVLN
jgi:hypothetical protein